MDITASKMISYFEDKIQMLNLSYHVEHPGKQPEYPMVVIFLGEEAMDGYPDIFARLSQLWPSYRNTFFFLGITGTAENLAFYRLCGSGGTMARSCLQQDEVQDLVASLSNRKNNFKNPGRKQIYTVLSTTGMKDASEYSCWMKVYQKVKNVLDLPFAPELLMLLLDEKNSGKQQIAKRVRNSIAEDGRVIEQIVLLSNRDSGGGTTDDWTSCYEIIANVIALTNNRERISSTLFQQGIYTVSYMCEKKPIKEIGWVVVTQIIEKLAAMKDIGVANRPFQDKTVYSRLLTDHHTFQILDDYVQKELVPRLPQKESLRLFPRRNTDRFEDPELYSAETFNEMTMGAWQCYLDLLIRDVEKKMEEKQDQPSELLEQWKNGYKVYLKNVFSVDELAGLAEHLEQISRMFECHFEAGKGDSIIEVAEQELKQRISMNPKVRSAFFDIVGKCSREAKESLAVWGKLFRSKNDVYPVNDETIIKYYGPGIIHYFDRHEKKIAEKLKNVTDAEQLEKFVKNMIDEIINSDIEVFLAAFDQERADRLRAKAQMFRNTNRDIQQKLTDTTKMLKYLNIDFGYGTPVASAVMLEFDTALETYMRENLDGDFYYYNTGSSDSAEVIEIYEVAPYNLIQD